MGNFWFYSPTPIACIHFLTTLGQMWPRLVFLQQAGRGAGKFCEKKVGGEGEAGEADTVDIGNGPETPKLTPQISPNFLCLAPVWINTLDVWTCSMYKETSLSVRFKDKSEEYPWLNVSKMICSSNIQKYVPFLDWTQQPLRCSKVFKLWRFIMHFYSLLCILNSLQKKESFNFPPFSYH